MGSKSDWPTMKWCADTLKKLQVKFDAKIISAHRTPDRMYNFAKTAEIENYSVIIAGAGGSAHLPGMISALTSLLNGPGDDEPLVPEVDPALPSQQLFIVYPRTAYVHLVAEGLAWSRYDGRLRKTACGKETSRSRGR